MTVAELIAELQKMPGDAHVFVVDDSESGEFYRSAELSMVSKEHVMHPDFPYAKTPVVLLA